MTNLGWIIVAVVAIAVLASLGRYEIVTLQRHGIVFKLDRFTGQVELVFPQPSQ